MSAGTGAPLAGVDHLRQSIGDILSTPLGSRVMRRDYGSRLPELIDRPTEPGLMIEIYAATAEALTRWEPRFRLATVHIDEAAAGRLSLTLSGTHLPDGKPVTIEGIVVQ